MRHSAMKWLGLCGYCWALAAIAEPKAARLEVAEVGFATPESVEYYAAEDVYLVTNINGHPTAADGNGFISKLKPDGTLIDLKWIDGAKPGTTLNAPKGAAVVGKHLFVADLDRVQVFALPSGKQKASIQIKGSTFLNGITPAGRDAVYVTDSGLDEKFNSNGTDAIYKVWANGKYQAVVQDKLMGVPNGIWADGKKLTVVTFGSGKMFSVDAKGKQSALPTPPKGKLDGLLKMPDGRFVMSSWEGSALYVLNRDQSFSVLAENLDAPADLGYDSKRKRLLIPLFMQNKVVILPY